MPITIPTQADHAAESACEMKGEIMTKWYCLDSDGDMKYVGEFASFEGASEFLDDTYVWLIDAEGARQWLTDLKSMLEN